MQDSVGGALSDGLWGRGLEKGALGQSLRGVACSEAPWDEGLQVSGGVVWGTGGRSLAGCRGVA